MPPNLSRRIAAWLSAYLLVLVAAVVLHGVLVNETAERLAWSSLLDAEMDHLLQRTATDPGWRWLDTETLELHRWPIADLPRQPLAALPPGLHDEVRLDGRELVVHVRDVGGERIVLALDISDLERRERELAVAMVLSAAVLAGIMVVAIAWGARRLMAPMAQLARRLENLDPERPPPLPLLAEPGSRELAVVVRAAESFLERSRSFVERERAFIDTASHELRTPVAVMAGAADLALAQPEVPPAVAHQLRRIRQEARNVERLISLLLVLARSPERLQAMSEDVVLGELLPEIVQDHLHLCRGKKLRLELAPPPPGARVRAPPLIVQAAIGNLLRNAIEHSDSGAIRIAVEPGPTVVIEDPGHGMSPEEISRLYRQLARNGGSEPGGIGLALIGRLCEHLGWRLALEPMAGRGARARLEFGDRAPA